MTAGSPTLVFDKLVYSADRHADSIKFTVVRLGDITGSSEVHYHAENLTAFAGLDFASTHGSLFFSPGHKRRSFSVPILDHAYFGHRSFHLVLADPHNATLVPDIDGSVAEVRGDHEFPQQNAHMSSMDSGAKAAVDLMRKENRAKNVMEPGLNAVNGATTQKSAKVVYEPSGLFIASTRITESDSSVIDYLLNNGAFTDVYYLKVKKHLLNHMIRSITVSYRYSSHKHALVNLEFRLWSAINMMRMNGIVIPHIDFSYADPDARIDRDFWDLNWPAKLATTKPDVNHFQAVVRGIERGVTRLECLTAMQSAYFIAAAEVLRVPNDFNTLFPATLKLGITDEANPFLTFASDSSMAAVTDLESRFKALRGDFIVNVKEGGTAWGPIYTKMNDIKKEINRFVAAKEVEAVTGDHAYFTNSRFYLAVFPKGRLAGRKHYRLC